MAEPTDVATETPPQASLPAPVEGAALASADAKSAAAPEPAKAEPQPAAPAQELAADKPTLLETFGKDDKPADAPDKPKEVVAKPADEPAPEVKPAEPPKSEEAKPEVKAPEAEPLPPIEYKFELPESIKPDDEKMSAFTEILGGARVPAEIGQKLVNMHSEAMSAYAEHLSREQHRVFNETRDGWRKDVMADETIGGSGHDTAMLAIARARDALVSSAKPGSPQYQQDMAELETMLRITGAGDHPVFLRMLHRAARFIDEPQAESLPTNITPPKGNGRRPGIYTHPTSQIAGT